jgi:hypothetical protein
MLPFGVNACGTEKKSRQIAVRQLLQINNLLLLLLLLCTVQVSLTLLFFLLSRLALLKSILNGQCGAKMANHITRMEDHGIRKQTESHIKRKEEKRKE